MNAMVLAAGLGTRLGALGRRVPKVLLPVGGRPLLARHLDALEREGVARVVINAYHLSSDVQAFVQRYSGGLELVCVVEQDLLGTAGGVRNALAYLKPGPCLVLYGDVLVEEPLARLVEKHTTYRPAATLAVHEHASAEGKGVVEIDSAGRVTRFVEKGDRRAGPSLINSGIYVLEEQLLARLPIGVPLDFGHDVFPRAVSEGLTLLTHQLGRPVIDVGTREGLSLAQARAVTE